MLPVFQEIIKPKHCRNGQKIFKLATYLTICSQLRNEDENKQSKEAYNELLC